MRSKKISVETAILTASINVYGVILRDTFICLLQDLTVTKFQSGIYRYIRHTFIASSSVEGIYLFRKHVSRYIHNVC